MSNARRLASVPGPDGANYVPFNPDTSPVAGSVAHALKQLIGRAPIDPQDFAVTVINTGAADATAAMQLAMNLSRTSGRPISAPGVYRIDGTLDPRGATFIFDAQQYGRENTTIADWGMVLQHNSASGSMFAPTGGEFVFDGVVFHDPLQVGGAPVVRPPMFDIASPYHAVDLEITNCVIVNAYDFMHSDSGSVCGDWRINGNRGYAVRYVFDFEGIVPEVVFSSDNIWSWGVWQSGAAIGSFGLAKWTGLNGAVLHVNTGAGSADGWKSDNEIIYGYRNHVKISSGLLNVSTFDGFSWDACIQPIRTEGNGGIVATFGGASKAYGYAYGNTATAQPAFYLHGTGVYDLLIDVQGQYAAGGWLEMITTGAGSVGIKGVFKNWGQASGATNINLADIEAPNINFSFTPSLVKPNKVDQNGLNIADIKVSHSSTTFKGCVQALTIGTCPSALKLRDASLVVETGAANSYSNAAGAKFAAAGTYDKP